MAERIPGQPPRFLPEFVDPRRSQAAGVWWLIAALSVTFAIGAASWVGEIARDNVVEQHARRLALETDQLSSDLSQAIAARLGAIRVMEGMLGEAGDPDRRLETAFGQLASAYPRFDWMLVATPAGKVIRSEQKPEAGQNVAGQAWFIAALDSPWIGQIDDMDDERRTGALRSPTRGINALGELAAPLKTGQGRVVGVVVARLSWQRSPNPLLRLTDESGPQRTTEASLIDANGSVIAGPVARLRRRWDGIPISGGRPLVAEAAFDDPRFVPRFERFADRPPMLVARSPLNTGGEFPSGHAMVQLSEPEARVYQRANAVRERILWVSTGLGLATAALGALGAHHLTRRLKRLSLSVIAVERDEAEHIEAPPGMDEVAQLGRAFSNVLNDLQKERAELETLSRELERRVEVRSREVERLADETRYAAVARERMKMARDLHDTLAHSMMALLSEIRYLRRLQSHDPGAVVDELARAEEVAHDGLKEVRAAISQMRATTVRETGLGPALSGALDRMLDRSGLDGTFTADPQAARFGDERAETLMQMCQEILRNVEKHAAASRVRIDVLLEPRDRLVLTIEDDGIGFDPKQPRAGHYGILGLEEQANLIGAQLSIESKPSVGTTVRICLGISPVEFAPAPSSA